MQCSHWKVIQQNLSIQQLKTFIQHPEALWSELEVLWHSSQSQLISTACHVQHLTPLEPTNIAPLQTRDGKFQLHSKLVAIQLQSWFQLLLVVHQLHHLHQLRRHLHQLHRHLHQPHRVQQLRRHLQQLHRVQQLHLIHQTQELVLLIQILLLFAC